MIELPKIEYPILEIYLHSLGRKVKFRPFLVKEEKLLLVAKEAKEATDIKNTIKQIIRNCALEPIDVDKLPLFDVEMLFLKLRAKSVGETVKLVFNCKNTLENGEVCNTDTDYALNLDKIGYDTPENHNSKIMITKTVGIKLKYPSLDTTVNFNAEDPYDMVAGIIADNIEYIFNEESVYKPEEYPQDKLVEFLENLTIESMVNIQEFFANQPKVVLEDDVVCKKCGFKHKLKAENILDFFI